jgi:hypothetical protein
MTLAEIFPMPGIFSVFNPSAPAFPKEQAEDGGKNFSRSSISLRSFYQWCDMSTNFIFKT